MQSIRQVRNGSNTVAAKNYQPYGSIIKGYNNATDYRYDFTGKQLDTETNYRYFGARYYDDIGRWTTVDPIASKYPGWSPYNYTLCNPINYFDPDGKKIRHHKNNSNTFRKNFATTIQYLNSNKISGIVRALENEQDIVTLKEGKWKFDTYYDPTTKTLFYNPFYALETSTGGKQTPSLGFLHESAHALRHLQDKKGFFNDLRKYNKQFANEEEKRVIENIENPAAIKAGEDIRTDHKGKPYRVKGPAQRKKVFDPIYEEDNNE